VKKIVFGINIMVKAEFDPRPEDNITVNYKQDAEGTLGVWKINGVTIATAKILGELDMSSKITVSALAHLIVTTKSIKGIDNTKVTQFTQEPFELSGDPSHLLSAISIGTAVAAHLSSTVLDTESPSTLTCPTTINLKGVADYADLTQSLDVRAEEVSPNVYTFIGRDNKNNIEVKLASLEFMAEDAVAKTLQTVATKSQGSAVIKFNGATESYDKSNTSSIAVLTSPIRAAILGVCAGSLQSVHSSTKYTSDSVTVIKISNFVQKA